MTRLIVLVVVLLAVVGFIPCTKAETKVCPKIFNYPASCDFTKMSQCRTHKDCQSKSQLCCPSDDHTVCKTICRNPYKVPPETCTIPINLVLLMDISFNLHSYHFKKAKRLARYLVDGFDISGNGTNVALFTTFGGHHLMEKGYVTEEPFELNNVQTKVMIDNLQHKDDYPGVYDLQLSLSKVYCILRVDNPRLTKYAKVLVFIGPGQQDNHTSLKERSRDLRNKGVEIFALAIGNRINNTRLLEMTNDPQRMFTETNFRKLFKAVQDVQQKQCAGQAVVSGVSTPKVCPLPLDLVFLLDQSDNINIDEWRTVLNLTSFLSYKYTISEDDTRLTIIRFGEDSIVAHAFNQRSGNDDVETLIQGLSGLKHSPKYFRSLEKTRIDKALSIANLHLTYRNGMRKDSLKVCIVLTNGNMQSTNHQGYIPLDAAAEPVKRKGFKIFAFGIGKRPNMTVLQQIASKPSSLYVPKPESFPYIDSIIHSRVQPKCRTEGNKNDESEATETGNKSREDEEHTESQNVDI